MKSRFIILLTALLTTSLLIGCGAESTTNQTESATAITTEESTSEQTEETTEESSEEVLTEAETTESTETAEAIDKSESSEASEPEQATETPVVEETKPEEPAFTFTEVTATKYATQSVNVRSGPSTDFNKIGSLSTNQEIQVIFRCNETGWYKFIWTDGSEVYVSDKYLSDSKVEVQKPADNSGSGTGSEASGSTASSTYQTGVWYDMGDYFCLFVNSDDEYWSYRNNCNDIRETLQARYPDRNTYVCSGANGLRILVVSALHQNEKGFPNWSEINYIPEIGIN